MKAESAKASALANAAYLQQARDDGSLQSKAEDKVNNAKAMLQGIGANLFAKVEEMKKE